jgi:YegS/Rv2252/BmrU family lipid kinase
MASTVVIAHGWKGKRAAAANALCDRLQQVGRQHHLEHTHFQGHAIELARRALVDGARHIIAVGGDGTVNEVVHGMMLADTPRGGADMSVIPCGSGNDVARVLRLRSIHHAIDIAASEAPDVVSADVLDIRYRAYDDSMQQRYCINVADVGLGGNVARIRDQQLRKLPGPLGYMLGIVAGMLSTTQQQVEITLDGVTRRQRVLTVCIANNTWFGGGLGIAPEASWTDGIADVVTIGDVSIPAYVAHLPGLRAARRLQDDRISYGRASTVSVTHLDEPLPLEIDGEYLGTTPIHVCMDAGAIRIRTA